MKLKLFLLIFAFVFSGMNFLNAENVELKEAKKVAKAFYNKKYEVNFPNASGTFQITESFINKRNDEAVIYIFNFDNDGFAIVPADDRLYPVVGFSFDGLYNPATIPENAKYVISEFGNQVIYVRENSSEATPEVISAWNDLRSDNTENLSFLFNNRDVDAMVLAMWNQDNPYNAFCPEDASGPGGHAYAGCVATAMSMIMYHWRYPEQGTGSHSYYCSPYGTLTANFGETTYPYLGMVNSSDSKLNEPIALLMYHCGVAVDMQYGPDGSGAYSNDVPSAIKNYFGYESNAQYIQRGGWAAWKAYLNQQMDWEQPVYYSGCDNGGCHAFVVDGYQEQTDDTYYHFNFGWSSSGNGWYLVTNAGGYNQSNAMVRNFIPDPDYYPYDPPEEQVLITYTNGTIDDCSGPKDNYQNNIDCSWLISPQTPEDSVTDITLTFNRFDTQADFDFVRIYDGPDVDSPLLGEFSGSDIPGTLTSTGNQVLITFTTNETVTYNGWFLSFESDQPTWCSGLQAYTEPIGTFDDGSGSFYYNNNTACMWKIEPLWASEVTLYFNYLDTEEGKDFVKVYDLDTQQLLAEVSGNEIPDPIVSPSGKMFITFNSNSGTRGLGWEVSYEISNVGIEEEKADVFENLTIFPNPAQNLIHLSFDCENGGKLNITLNSMNGSKIYNENISNFDGSYNNSIDVSGLAKGVYFISIISEKATAVKKLVIE